MTRPLLLDKIITNGCQLVVTEALCECNGRGRERGVLLMHCHIRTSSIIVVGACSCYGFIIEGVVG